MSSYGNVVDVEWRSVGSTLAAAAAAAATSITLENAEDFPVGGGHVRIDGAVYDYTAADHTAMTLQLGTGLADAMEESEPVELYDNEAADVFATLVAHVRLDPANDNDDAVEAQIKHDLIALLPEGDRGGPGEAVRLERTKGGTLYVDDVLRRTPAYSGTYIDPATLPVPSDGDAPVAAPTPTVEALGYSGLMIRWTDPGNADQLRYRVFLDTVDPPLQELTDTSGHLAATSVLPDGTPLVPGTLYYAQIETYDVDGDGPLGAVASGTPVTVPADAVSEDVLVVNELFTREGYFGAVSADQVTAGELLAALAIVGGLAVGPGITIDPDNGIVVVTPQGPTRFPTDGSSITLSADVIANSLTVIGNLAIRGTSNELAKGASVTLSEGTTAPKVGPSLTSVYPQGTIHNGFSPRGMTYHATLDRFLQVESIGGTATVTATEYNAGTGNYDFTFQQFGMEASRPEIQTANGGITVVPGDDHIYTLCHVDIPNGVEWYIYKWSYTGNPAPNQWAYVSRLLYAPGFNLGGRNEVANTGSSWHPTIGNDGTDLLIAQANRDGDWYVSRYSATPVHLSTTPLHQADGTTDFTTLRHAGGVVGGTTDIGSARWFVAHQSYPYIFVFNTSGVRQSADEFWSPVGNLGLMWDGTRFKCRDLNKAYHFSQIKETTLASSPVNAVQTWRRHDAADTDTAEVGDFATYETSASPRSQSTALKKRAYVQIMSGAPIPDDPGDPDTADAVSFYIARGTGTPSNASYERVVPEGVGDTITLLDVLPTSGNPPPTSSTFPDATPGELRCTPEDGGGPLWYARGDGSWRWGHLEGNDDGTNANDTGWVTVTSSVTGAWGIMYRKVDSVVSIIVNGSFATTSGTNHTIASTGALPAEARPDTEVRTGGYFSTHPGTVTVLASGAIQCLQQSGAGRATVAAHFSYHV